MDIFLAEQGGVLSTYIKPTLKGEKMDLYLADGSSSLKSRIGKEVKKNNNMDIYMAGGEGHLRKDIYEKGKEEDMDIYLAGGDVLNGYIKDKEKTRSLLDGTKILQSFYYADEFTEFIIPRLKKFMLDSGAYTFFSKGKHIDWEDYIKKYAAFIVRNKVDLFFELDIDSLVGYKKVLEYRKMLEDLTGKKCIPVWHFNRGKEEFIKMCKEYDYVAIGGLVSEGTSSEYSRKYQKYFKWFIDVAHENGAKIHGLGFTNLKGLEKYHFDSVDSTSWVAGNRFGNIYKFNGKTMVKFDKKQGQRLSNPQKVAVNNFKEWVKFSEYAEKHL